MVAFFQFENQKYNDIVCFETDFTSSLLCKSWEFYARRVFHVRHYQLKSVQCIFQNEIRKFNDHKLIECLKINSAKDSDRTFLENLLGR